MSEHPLVVQVEAPSRPIDRGMASAALLAHVLVSKYADHLPLYRQSEIYARQGFTDFVLAAGYKCELIEEFAAALPSEWTVDVVDTGLETNTGGRVQRVGDRVVNQGPTNQAYLVNMLVAFAGGPEAIRRVTVRFLGNVFAGERVECRGRVSEVDREAGLVTVELEETADGRPVMAGSAVVALPA